MDILSPESAGFSSKRLRRIDHLMQGYVDRCELPGMIATIARCGQTVYYGKFGWMDVEARRPMQDDTIFMIASMTKPVTSVAIMMLYEEGHFNLNTPISKFIPAFKNTQVFARETENGIECEELKQEITFRHLFTHTSGLTYGGSPEEPVGRLYHRMFEQSEKAGHEPDLQEFIENLAGLPLAFQPGAKWLYSFAIDVLGGLVEIISGQSLADFCKERIFQPLQMPDTAFYVPPDKMSRLATVYGHPEPEKVLKPLTDIRPPADPPIFLSGGGGLTSTTHDYARFAQMLVNGGELDGVRILGPKTVAMFTVNQAPVEALPYGFVPNDAYHAGYGYSLGTRVLMDPAKNGQYGSVGEFGWDGAFNTYFWVDPVEELYGLLMLQHSPNLYYPVAPQFKALAYQAVLR